MGLHFTPASSHLITLHPSPWIQSCSKSSEQNPSTWHFVSRGCAHQSSKATKGKTCCFQEYIKAGSVGLDVCLISVLRWLYPSQEGWDGAAQVPPTEGVCSRSFCTKEYHDFHHLTFSQPTEQKSSSRALRRHCSTTLRPPRLVKTGRTLMFFRHSLKAFLLPFCSLPVADETLVL